MNDKNTGGPAFPVADPFAVKCPPTDSEALRLQQGMALRDYFAAKAMQGVIAGWGTGLPPSDTTASAAYAYADAMLKAREA